MTDEKDKGGKLKIKIKKGKLKIKPITIGGKKLSDVLKAVSGVATIGAATTGLLGQPELALPLGIVAGVASGSGKIAEALGSGLPKEELMKLVKQGKLKRVGSKEECFNGNCLKTKGGLFKIDLEKNTRGKIVSKKASAAARKRMQERIKNGDTLFKKKTKIVT